MREIKFRAWDNNHKEMTHFDLSSIAGYDIQLNVVEIMQYTGLKDKNGKEIYEGDVLHYPYFDKLKDGSELRVNVVWDVDKNGWHVEGWNGDPHWYECEVIGNIHENPEFLNKK